jgi:hypothetical protein
MKKLIYILLIASMGANAQKISQLPSATSLSGSDLVPVVQGGVNKKAAYSLFGGGGGGTWGSITGTLSSQTDLNTALNNRELIANKATNLSSPDNTKYPTTLAVSNALSGLGNTGGQRTFQTATVTANAVTLDCLTKAMSNFQITNSTNITFTISNLIDGDELFVKLTTTANTTLTFTGAESIFYNTPISGTSTILTGASSTSVYHLAIKKIGANLSIIIQQVKA